MRKEEEEVNVQDLFVSAVCIKKKGCMIINASQANIIKCDQQREAIVTNVFNAILTCT